MQVNDYLIPQIFTKGTLVIPFFQRAYVWKEENWKRFFDDMAQLAATPEKERRVYFLGSIILHKDNNCGRFDVIDGQQRLTTIVMFMKALYLMTSQEEIFKAFFTQFESDGNRIPKLIPSSNDKSVYDEIVLTLDTANPNYAQKKKKNLLAECFSYFVTRMLNAQDPQKGIDEDHTTVTAREVLNCMNQYVHIVVIDVEDTEDSQVIFETINSAGVRLTTAELLKNYLFSGETDYQRYQNGWQRTFEQLNLTYWEGDQTTGRIAKGQIENFLYQFMLVKMQDPEIKPRLTRNRIKQYRKSSGLYDHYHSMVEELELDKLLLADEIADNANTYHEIFNECLLETALPAFPGRTRLAALMSMEDTYTMVPYILYVEKNVHDLQERENIYSYLESYLVRRIICKSKNNNYSDMFSENLIGSGINTAQKFMEYVNDTSARGSLLMPTDEDIKEALMNNNLANSARTLLYLIESKENITFTESIPDINGYEKIQVEAMMPNKHFENNTNWPLSKGYDIEQRSKLVNTLGNYILLRDSKLKSSQSSKAWNIKCLELEKKTDGLFNSFLVLCAPQDWNDEAIKNRNEALAEEVIKYWPIDEITYIDPSWKRTSGVNTIPQALIDNTTQNTNKPIQAKKETKRIMRRYGLGAAVGENVKKYENIYIDGTVELYDTLNGWLEDFFKKQNPNGLFRIDKVECLEDEDGEKIGYIYLRNKQILPFVAKYKADVNNGTLYRIFFFSLMTSQQYEKNPIDFEDEINTLAYDGLWN